MIVSPNQRIQNWAAKFKTDRVKASLDEKRQAMLERYADVTARLCAMEISVKQLLDFAGVSTILYVPYLNYGRQLFKLSRQRDISGNSFAMASQVLLTTWANRGLDPEVLDLIRTQVFDTHAP
jgi:hypothetical protein